MSLRRTRGYDFANVWLNFLKLVLGLLVIYRYALTDQLKIDIFRNYHIVDSTLARQIADNSNPFLQLRFIPVVMRGRIEALALEIAPEGSRDALVRLIEAPRAGEIQQLTLPLADVLRIPEGQPLASGTYRLSYVIHFRENGRNVLTWPDQEGSVARTVTVDYAAQSLALGTFLITRGDAANYPEILRRRPHTFTSGLSSQTLRADESAGVGRFAAAPNAPLGTAKVSGNFTDGKLEQFSLDLHVLPNEPPISICGSSPTRINLYYEDRQFLDNYQAYGLDLSACVIDPDGHRVRPVAAPRGFLLGSVAIEPSVAVTSIALQKALAGYSIGRRLGRFYLLVTGKGPAPGAQGDTLVLLADGHPIDVVVQRKQ